MTQTFLFLQPRDAEQIPNAASHRHIHSQFSPSSTEAEASERPLRLIPADVSCFPRPKFKNPKIATANVLGTDAEEGQSGSSSPRETMLKSGQTPATHISLQMARATFNSRNHRRLSLLIMYITVFIDFFFLNEHLLPPSPPSF